MTKHSDFFDYVDTSDADAIGDDVRTGKVAWGTNASVAGTANFAQTINAPTEVSGLEVWLDGSDPGVTALTWDDKSGNANHYTSSIAGEFPTYQSGDNSMLFDGGDWLTGPSLASLTQGEVFIKLKAASSTLGKPIWWMGNIASGTEWHPWTDGTLYNGWGSTSRRATGLSPGVTLTNYHTMNIHSKPNQWSMMMNGTAIFVTLTNTVGFRSAPLLGKGQSGDIWNGNVQSMCIFNRVLTSIERKAMNDYMDTL